MRAIAYTRVSTIRQAEEGFSLAAQQDAIEEFASAAEIPVEEFFEDAGLSGTSDNRPAFQALIDRVRRGGITHVLAYNIDRLARDDDAFTSLAKELG